MKIFDNEEAVSEVLGYVVILGIIITALGVFLIVAMPSIGGAKGDAQMGQSEQAFTVADSRMSKARFSTSIFQEIPFKVTDGTIYVDNDAGEITVTDVDTNVNPAHETTLYQEKLGTMKFVGNDAEIAYQDGGVWKKYPDIGPEEGGCIMLSPPDFNYNGVTLTLPVTLIRGQGSCGYSDSTAIIDAKSTGSVNIFYPNDVKNWANPIKPGHYIVVSITSDYYRGWYSYISECVKGAIPEYDAVKPKTVNIRLSSGAPRQSGMYDDGFKTTKMDTSTYTPIEEFYLDLFTINQGNDYWLTYGVTPQGPTTPDPQLLISASRHKGGENKDYADITIKYISGTQVEIFDGTVEYHRKTENELAIDMLSRTDTLTYRGDSSAQSITWGTDQEHYDTNSVTGLIDGADVTAGGTKTLYDITQHYLWLMATKYPTYGPVYKAYDTHNYDPDTSTYALQYKSKQDIKYLYITDGTLDISLGSRSA